MYSKKRAVAQMALADEALDKSEGSLPPSDAALTYSDGQN